MTIQVAHHTSEKAAGETPTRLVGTAHVVLPAFDEEESLPPLLTRLAAASRSERLVVWVVDDGSRDGTVDVVMAGVPGLDLRLVRHPVNLGLGQAVQSGLRAVLAALTAPALAPARALYVDGTTARAHRCARAVVPSTYRARAGARAGAVRAASTARRPDCTACPSPRLTGWRTRRRSSPGTPAITTSTVPSREPSSTTHTTSRSDRDAAANRVNSGGSDSSSSNAGRTTWAVPTSRVGVSPAAFSDVWCAT